MDYFAQDGQGQPPWRYAVTRDPKHRLVSTESDFPSSLNY